METNETRKLNEVQISTYLKHSGGGVVQVTLPNSPPFAGEPHFVIKHTFGNAAEAGRGIHDLKEFYKYFDFDLM